MSRLTPKKSSAMTPDEILQTLRLFRTADAIAAGVSQPTLWRLVESGVVTRVDNGIFLHSKTQHPENFEFVLARMRVGAGTLVGGLTALFYYQLIEQVPEQTWLILPRSNRGTFLNYKIIRTKRDPTLEIDDHGNWQMVNIERAIIEAFRYATKIGLQIALEAARTAISESKTSESKLLKAAKNLNMRPVLLRHWEAITTK
ncbi:MAG: type IV toxin-antitoxin system AbiEi family antitoxin domain-containing protein [Oligoflexus sp.]|nr:type IV toxin-antitoxin system AbiEi family antitoxin domain-containing protein [Oligoflexus sp.]